MKTRCVRRRNASRERLDKNPRQTHAYLGLCIVLRYGKLVVPATVE